MTKTRTSVCSPATEHLCFDQCVSQCESNTNRSAKLLIKPPQKSIERQYSNVRDHCGFIVPSNLQYWFLLIISFLIIGSFHAKGTIQVNGIYEAAKYNPNTRELYSDTFVRAEFYAAIGSNSWMITATNLSDQKTSQVWFDGTNTITINRILYGEPKSNVVFVTVANSPLYMANGQDFLHISLPWITYCCSPRIVSQLTNKSGLLDIPLPWLKPRHSPQAFGYKWLMEPDGRQMFLKSCSMVRDSSLDLDDSDELLRPELIFPDNRGNLELYEGSLRLRKAMRDGFVQARYECTATLHTNGVEIPSESRLRYYLPDAAYYSDPWFEGKLRVTAFGLSSEQNPLKLPPPSEPTVVRDYRYRSFNGVRLFRAAQYTLNQGDVWRGSDDPRIISEVRTYMQNGPRYDDFGISRELRMWAFRLLLGALILLPIAILIKCRKRTNRTNTSNI